MRTNTLFFFRTTTLLLLFLALLNGTAQARPAKVLLLRHGEKPADGSYGLSQKGWARAQAMRLLFNHPEFRSLGIPVALFAQKPGQNNQQARPFQTLQYLAQELHQTIDTSFSRDQPDAIASRILNDPSFEGKLVLICWEHKLLGAIAAALGANPRPIYSDNRFDLAWLLTYGSARISPRLDVLPEYLLPGDAAP